LLHKELDVTPGQKLSISIGLGGVGGFEGTNGSAGTRTTIGPCCLPGGGGGQGSLAAKASGYPDGDGGYSTGICPESANYAISSYPKWFDPKFFPYSSPTPTPTPALFNCDGLVGTSGQDGSATLSGGGGGNPFGSGGAGQRSNGTKANVYGQNGSGFGSGGGGSNNAKSTGSSIGGNGANGMVQIYW
jgi:hypothetical protein